MAAPALARLGFGRRLARGAGPRTAAAVSPLTWILALAVVLRVYVAAMPVFRHSDEFYQYLEPAWRLLTGDGVVTWEYRLGMRGWLLPTLLTVPTGLGERLSPGSALPALLAHLAAAAASLSIVWSAWRLGMRRSTFHATIAALAAATWFEIVYFSPATLTGPLAAAALFPAAVLLTEPEPSRRALIASGALLALAMLLRLQYAPAAAALAVIACGRALPGRLLPMIAGGGAMLAFGAACDLAQGAPPLGWVIENFRQNIVEGNAAEYGVAPPLFYLTTGWRQWSVLALPILLALPAGRRHSPPLFWAAVVTIVLHSLIGHKEYRFIYLAVAILIVLAALGSADLVRKAQARLGAGAARRLSAALALAWLGGSAALAATGTRADLWHRDTAGIEAFTMLREDIATCGVALVGVPFDWVPGKSGLRPNTPIYLIQPWDPAVGEAGVSPLVARDRAQFNRVVASARIAAELTGFEERACWPPFKGGICVLERDGPCRAAPRSPLAINAALRRIGR